MADGVTTLKITGELVQTRKRQFSEMLSRTGASKKRVEELGKAFESGMLQMRTDMVQMGIIKLVKE